MTEVFSRSSGSNYESWASIEVIAMDIDGTLTTHGLLTTEVISALHALRAQGLKLCLVTGRPSGWAQALASYLPVDAAIAENGGVVFLGPEAAPLVRNPTNGHYEEAASNKTREPLAKMFAKLLENNPGLMITGDNVFRLSDFTFHSKGLSAVALSAMKNQVESSGLAFAWSTIHAHIMPQGQEKGTALEWLLQKWGIKTGPATTTLTIGDSPNDAPLFAVSKFPHSAGVANVVKYREVMSHYPSIVSTQPEGSGLVEIVNILMNIRGGAL
ncbi:MAG: HAD-IIB family hydrolase [Silvanigrellaceae bacterium]